MEDNTKLYKLITAASWTYWVIAKDPTEAVSKLEDILTQHDYGFRSDRVVKEIHFIADVISKNSYSIIGKHLIL